VMKKVGLEVYQIDSKSSQSQAIVGVKRTKLLKNLHLILYCVDALLDI
jgi:hypothetical protein